MTLKLDQLVYLVPSFQKCFVGVEFHCEAKLENLLCTTGKLVE